MFFLCAVSIFLQTQKAPLSLKPSRENIQLFKTIKLVFLFFGRLLGSGSGFRMRIH